MARPQTNKVDYFPHPVRHGKKMSYLEKKYKNDGYATWLKILEELGSTDYHYLDLSDEVQLMFLSDRCLVSEEVLINIINDLIRLKEFDKKLWEENRILFNQKFIESIKDAYKKRSNECINRKSLLILLSSLGIRKPDKSNPKPSKKGKVTPINPQSKVEYSKVKEKRENAGEKTPLPSLAFELLKIQKTTELESFEMQNKKNVEKWKELVESFNDTVEIEIQQGKIEFDVNQLMPRLRKFTRSWIGNQSKFGKKEIQPNSYESGKLERF